MLQRCALADKCEASPGLLCTKQVATKSPLMTSVRKRVSSRLGPVHSKEVSKHFHGSKEIQNLQRVPATPIRSSAALINQQHPHYTVLRSWEPTSAEH